MKPVRISSVLAISGLLLSTAIWGVAAQDSLSKAKRAFPPLRIGWEVMQAKQLHKRLPKYPLEAEHQRVTGAVRLDISASET